MRQVLRSNFRLEVYPELYNSNIKEEPAQRLCGQIEQQIKRHVDGVSQIIFSYDQKIVCEHCGYVWEWGDEEPGCCQKATDEWDAIKKVKA